MNELEKFAASTQQASALLKELANESRLMICCAIAEGELSVSELNELVPLSQSALSQHLARLRSSSIVETRKESLTVYYRLADDGVLKIIGTLKGIFCP